MQIAFQMAASGFLCRNSHIMLFKREWMGAGVNIIKIHYVKFSKNENRVLKEKNVI